MKIIYISILLFFVDSACSNNNSLEIKIDQLFKELNNVSSPGAAIAVKKDGEMVYKKSFGMADIENKKKNQQFTNFRLASITKQFTSLSVLLLENEGKLSLEDKIIEHFPKLSHYADKITIKNILQHTSGFLDYEDFVDETDSLQLKDRDVLEILSKQDSTYFEPGSEHRYSNSGYAVLALLIERISGLSFAEYLENKIFNPLKMKGSVAYEKGISTVSDRAFGYTKTDTGYIFTDQSLTSAVLGDGGIYSSVNDLLKWDIEVESPTLLPPEKFSEVFVKGKTKEGEEFDYGFGWRLDPYKNFDRIYHTGGTRGFTNIYMKIPELDLTVILLMNINNNDAKTYAEKIVDILISDKNRGE